MNRPVMFTMLGAALLLLSGCLGGGPKQDAGALTGAVAGGIVGGAVSKGNLGAVATGALVGGAIGSDIGANLDAAERRMVLDAQYRALEYGRVGAPVQWRGKTGRYGDVVAGAQYRVNDYNCRDYTQTITIDGRSQTARGTACRQPDGTWKPVA